METSITENDLKILGFRLTPGGIYEYKKTVRGPNGPARIIQVWKNPNVGWYLQVQASNPMHFDHESNPLTGLRLLLLFGAIL